MAISSNNRVLPSLPPEIWKYILTHDVNLDMIQEACSDEFLESNPSMSSINDGIALVFQDMYYSIKEELGEENFQALENWTREQEGSLPENINERLYVLFNRVKKDAIASTSVDYVDSIIKNPIFGECSKKTFLFFYYLSQSLAFKNMSLMLYNYSIPLPNFNLYNEFSTYLNDTFIPKIRKHYPDSILLARSEITNISTDAFISLIKNFCEHILQKTVPYDYSLRSNFNLLVANYIKRSTLKAILIPDFIQSLLTTPLARSLAAKNWFTEIFCDFYINILHIYFDLLSAHYQSHSPMQMSEYRFPVLPHVFSQRWFAFDSTKIRFFNIINPRLQASPDIFVLPKQLCQYRNLTDLSFTKYGIQTIPDSIENLTNLQSLNLSHNNIAALSSNIENLTNLQSLNLSHNNIAALSSNIENLTNLRELKLKNNCFKTFPPGLEKLENLEILKFLGNCPLSYKTLNDAFISQYFSSCEFSYDGMDSSILLEKFHSLAHRVNTLFISNIFLYWTLRPIIQSVFYSLIGTPYLLLRILRHIIYNFVLIPIGAASYSLFWIGKKICILITSSNFYTRISSTVKNIFYRFSRSFFSQKNSWKIFYPIKKLCLISTIYLINDFKHHFKYAYADQMRIYGIMGIIFASFLYYASGIWWVLYSKAQ